MSKPHAHVPDIVRLLHPISPHLNLSNFYATVAHRAQMCHEQAHYTKKPPLQ